MTIGDGHDLTSPRFAGDSILEACFDTEHRMLEPESGPAVASVQRALVDLGFLPSYRDADGQFGPKTGDAVTAFKVERSLFPTDPVVGPKTIQALNDLFQPRPFVTGAFAGFVLANRVDEDIADLLNELDGFLQDTWAHQTAAFAHHELTIGNLLAMVSVGNAFKVTPLIPPAFQPKLLQLVSISGTFNATTEPVEVNPNQFQGYTLVRDDFLVSTHMGGPNHGFGLLVMAHEMTHFRNRDFFVALDRSAVAGHPDLYVDPVLAASFADTQRVASIFMQELMCDHVSFRVKQDMDRRNGRVPPALQPGQLYRFAINLARGTFDNGYKAALSPTDFNQQVAIWMGAAGHRLFHDDPVKNAEVAALFDAEVNLASPFFATPTVSSAGAE